MILHMSERAQVVDGEADDADVQRVRELKSKKLC
jgi:hypothetical protein